MKRTALAYLFVFTAVWLSALSAGAQKRQKSDLEVKYDAFRNRTTITTPESQIDFKNSVWELGRYTGGYGTIMVLYGCDGDARKAPCRSPAVAVVFRASSRTDWGWEWDRDHEVDFLADGKRVAPHAQPKWDGHVDPSQEDAYPLTETVMAVLTLREFHRMATADQLKGEIAADRFSLSKEARSEWRQMDRAILAARRGSAR